MNMEGKAKLVDFLVIKCTKLFVICCYTIICVLMGMLVDLLGFKSSAGRVWNALAFQVKLFDVCLQTPKSFVLNVLTF